MVRALLTAAVIAAAITWAPAASADPPGIAGTSWRFVEVMGATPPATVQPTLQLSADGAAKGNSGCTASPGTTFRLVSI